ncbi:MAG: thiamine pyrophosphate-binding protein [Hyphomicrobiales bacterium]
MTRGADLLARTLHRAGVRTIFSLSGNQIMPVYDACMDAGIRVIHTRHECAAVFMADAWAQLTGEVGVALVTAAPGFANSLGGLFSARQAESPVLLLSGDSPLGQDGRGAFQELDQAAVSAPLTKLSLRARDAASLGADVAKAMRTARSGRPGPVHMALPFDVLNADAGGTPVPEDFAPGTAGPPEGFIREAAAALASASRPLILTGAQLNATRAGGLLAKLSDAAGTPAIPMESPRGIGDPALGNLAEILARADVIVSIGKKLDYTLKFGQAPAIAETARLFIADPEEEALQASIRAAGPRLAASCLAGARATAVALVEAAGSGGRHEYRDTVARALAARPRVPQVRAPIHPAVLCAAVEPLLREAADPVLVVDGGEFGQWAQACLAAPARVINGTSGAIGGGLCYAIAAKAARPGATVIVLMGDGTIGFHLAEFETAAREGLEVLAVVGNDARWNAEYQIQLRDYGPDRTYACELSPARYDEAVAGLGGHGEFVREPGELDAALRRALASGRPACVNVMIEGAPAPSGASH